MEWRGVGVERDGCSRWPVAGGDDGGLIVVARKTVPTVAMCVGDQTEKIEKIPPPTHYFIVIFVSLIYFFRFLF